jgi:hypothetical protein
MIGIPEWAIGVGVIILFVAAAQVLVRLLLPDSARRDLRARMMNRTAQ